MVTTLYSESTQEEAKETKSNSNCSYSLVLGSHTNTFLDMVYFSSKCVHTV